VQFLERRFGLQGAPLSSGGATWLRIRSDGAGKQHDGQCDFRDDQRPLRAAASS